MKLRKPCQHGRYEPHAPPDWWLDEMCPGGVFLPDDTLVIEQVDGEWPDAVGRDSLTESVRYERVRLALDSLTVRKAE